MQLSILGEKGRGASLDFQYFRKPSLFVLVHVIGSCYKCTFLMVSCVFEIIFDFKLTGKNERPPYLAFGSQVCCFLTHCDPFVEVSFLLPFLCLFFASISLDFFRVT